MSTKSPHIMAVVWPNPAGYELAGSAAHGTIFCTLYDLENLFGQCHDTGDEYKVSKEWFFETPRGRAAIRDWHCNPENVYTIAAADPRAALWIAAYCRRLGLDATGVPSAKIKS